MSTKIQTEFERYATNLKMYLPRLEGKFLCPVCFRLFGVESIGAKRVSIEHIVPKSLGGRHTTLVCTNCNNSQGSQLDAQLVQRLRVEDILTGESEEAIRGRLETQRGEFGADIFFSRGDPNIRIVGIPEISNPSLHELAGSDFEGGTPVVNLSASLGYRDTPSRVAAVRQGYLMMFRFFGYGYVLFKHTDCIRRQILNPADEGDPLRGLLWIQRPPKCNVVAILKEPKELRCFVAIVDLSTEVERYLAVVMPGMEAEGESIYERWRAVGQEQISRLKPSLDVVFYNPSFLTDKANKHLPLRLWGGHTVVTAEQQ